MVEVAAYLGTSLFFGFLLLYAYRVYVKKTRVVINVVKVPLRVDRTALLEKQRQEVKNRRSRQNGETPVARSSQPSDSVKTPPVSREESGDTGFGEDLSAAMKLDRIQDADTPDVQKRVAGRSRFAALQDAADQFKEIYNRNNQL